MNPITNVGEKPRKSEGGVRQPTLSPVPDLNKPHSDEWLRHFSKQVFELKSVSKMQNAYSFCGYKQTQFVRIVYSMLPQASIGCDLVKPKIPNSTCFARSGESKAGKRFKTRRPRLNSQSQSQSITIRFQDFYDLTHFKHHP